MRRSASSAGGAPRAHAQSRLSARTDSERALRAVGLLIQMLQDGASIAYRPDVARPAPPVAAVPVHDGANGAHCPDVARPAPPNAGERPLAAARDSRPGAAVPVQDGAEDFTKTAHRPDV